MTVHHRPPLLSKFFSASGARSQPDPDLAEEALCTYYEGTYAKQCLGSNSRSHAKLLLLILLILLLLFLLIGSGDYCVF